MMANRRFDTMNVDAIKIGRGTPESRRLDCQTGNPNTLEIILFKKMDDDKSATFLEMRIHNELDDYRIRGEWFYPIPTLEKAAEYGFLYWTTGKRFSLKRGIKKLYGDDFFGDKTGTASEIYLFDGKA
jgi:nucleoside-specific outer membrane channel protein Tsx